MVGTRVGPRITPEDKIERDQKICALRKQGIRISALAERFGVSIPTIRAVVNNGKEMNDGHYHD